MILGIPLPPESYTIGWMQERTPSIPERIYGTCRILRYRILYPLIAGKAEKIVGNRLANLRGFAPGGAFMKKLKDENLFRILRSFLTVHLPEQRACSGNTIKSYREALNLLLAFIQAKKDVPLFNITFKMLNSAMILEFLSWLENERNCSASTRNQRLASNHNYCIQRV